MWQFPQPLIAAVNGRDAARELHHSGRRIAADEAMRVGLVNSINEPQQLLDAALTMAGTIIEAPQGALEYTEHHLISSPSSTFEQAFSVEHDGVFDDFLQGTARPRNTR